MLSTTIKTGWSSWWRDVVKNGTSGSDDWFWHGLERRIGDGGKTKFWEDVWVGDCAFKTLFPRLYSLNLTKEYNIKDMGDWREGIWEWNWRWRRTLFGRENDSLNSLLSLIHRFSPNEGMIDEWIWKGKLDGKYTTR